MKTRFSFSLRIGAASLAMVLVAVFCVSTAFGQLAAVKRYTVTTETGTWIDATVGNYLGYDDDGYYTFSAPFAIPYDSTNVAAGANMTVSDNGVVEINQDYYVSYADDAEGNASYPGALSLYSTDMIYDLNSVSNHGNYWIVTGSAPNRILTMEEYSNSPYYYSTPVTSFEAQIHETSGVIEFLYSDHSLSMVGSDNYNPVGIGLNGLTNASADYYSVGNGTSTPSTDVKFSPPALLPPAQLSLTPKGTLNFGAATPNTPDTLYATVHNVGPGGTELHIKGIGISGSSAYSIIAGSAKVGDSIAAASSEQIGIQFQPFTAGVITGILTVQTDGRDSGTQQINLTGVGAVAAVSYSAASMFRGVDVEVTKTSPVQYLYVNSSGNGPLLILNAYFIGLNASSYTITHVPVGPLAPGTVDSIGVVFAPTFEGVPDAHLVINSTGVNLPWDTVGLFGVGILPHLSIGSGNSITAFPNPLKVSFDSVSLGSDSCLSITVSNPGSDTLAIEKNYFSSADVDFALTPLTAPDTLIPPGGSQTVQVCFAPVQRGYRTATLHIVTNIPHTETAPTRDTSAFDVVIEGTGVPNNSGVLVGYGRTSDTSVVGTQSCWIDTIKNIGTGPATIDTIVISDGGMTSTFPLVGTLPPFPYVLQADSILTFSVCSTPTDTGIWTDPSNPLNTGNYGPWAIAIRSNVTPNNGNPFFPEFFVYGIEIGDTAIIETPFSSACGLDTETILVLNTENVPESYTATIGGGTNPNDFTVLPPTTSPIEAAGDAASFQVVFNPTTTSVETSNLNISGGIPQSVLLTSKGSAASIAGSDPAPITSIGATSGQFTVTVNNTGSCAWTTGIPTVDPQFSYVSGATTIAAGGSAPFVFTYTPTVAGGTTYPVTFPSSVGLSTSVNVSITTATDGVNTVSASNGYALGQTYPNPSTGTSDVEITVPVSGKVSLTITDVTGNTVENVLDRQFDAGTYSVTVNSDGLPSGTYYYQMSAAGVTLTRQMTIVK